MNKDGFTLLELVICVSIITILMTTFHLKEISIDFSLFHFLNDYYHHQMNALMHKEEMIYDDYAYIRFNEKGNVNKGQTIHLNKHKVFVHVGNGSLRYE